MRTPEQLGRYRIISELGRGAMGIVYKAEDTVLERPVAIKTIQLAETDELSEREEYEARFLQEAKASARLNHPCIITIFDVGREGDLAYMAMELLNGEDLRERMIQRRLPVPDALDIGEQLAEGLAAAHEQGVVHRDIKPANIMLVQGGRIKIMDFGVARIQFSDFKTRTGLLLGTPKYMSPEQVSGQQVDHRSDIFSLGIVLYEMVTNSTLFSGADTTEVINNVANQKVIPPSRLNRDSPQMFDLVVAKALEKDPATRYQDAAELAFDLRACLQDLADNQDANTSSSTQTLSGRTIRRARAISTQSGSPDTGTSDENSKTIRLVKDTVLEASTLLPTSLRFNSPEALERLANPSQTDRMRLSRQPAPSNGLKRLLRDADQRLSVGLIVAGMLAGLIIAFA